VTSRSAQADMMADEQNLTSAQEIEAAEAHQVDIVS
jgi:hypothetical protein